MANIPVYITWTAGSVVTASQLNSQIRDAGNFMLAKPYCYLYNNVGPSIANITLTLLSFDSEVEDNDNMHSTLTNPSRMIFQTTGLYLLMPCLAWTNNPNGGRYAQLRLNAAGNPANGTQLQTVAAQAPANLSGSGAPEFTLPYRAVNVGDYVELFVEQGTGGALTMLAGTNNRFAALWQNA